MDVMSSPQPPQGSPTASTSSVLLRLDLVVTAMVVLGLLLLYAPTTVELMNKVWVRDEQGHGPIIVAVTLWLMYAGRERFFGLTPDPRPLLGGTIFAFGLLVYVIGRSQAVLMLEAGSLIPTLIGLLLLLKGPGAVRVYWFPLFFLLFMVPLPATLVVAVTTPLKTAVSSVASSLLYYLGYPIGRSGVILTVGPYQLLVADACAGLNSMFTLEALGLLYMNLMQYKSAVRNVLLAILIVPISFVANIVRVCILVLVTYHFGDEAGQGFVHGFAGMVLFLVALTLILIVDQGLRYFSRLTDGRKEAA